jgi:hypothetical protein
VGDLAKAASRAVHQTVSEVGMVTAPCSLGSGSGAVQEMGAQGWTSMARSSETLALGTPWARRLAAAAETARDDGPLVVQSQPVERRATVQRTLRMIRSVGVANGRRHQAAISSADDQVGVRVRKRPQMDCRSIVLAKPSLPLTAVYAKSVELGANTCRIAKDVAGACTD